MLVLLVLLLVQILVDHHLSILEDKYLLMHLLPNADLPIDPNMPDLEDDSNVFLNDGIFSEAYDDEDVGAETDFNNMDNTIDVSPIPTLRVHKDHPKGQILGDPKSAVQTRGKIQKASSVQQVFVSYIYNQNRTNHKDHQNCLLACFLSQKEPKTISQALEDESWVEEMQEELLQFKLQKEEGIDYDEGFATVTRIEAIRLFLAFASFMGFPVYQMDVKNAFLYGTIKEEVYVHQPPGFVDPTHPNKVYKVIKALYGLHQAPRAWYETLSSFLLKNGFRRGTIDKILFIKKNKSDIMLVQVKQQPDGIFISQDKYVADILKKFDFCSIKTATTPIVSNKPLVKDEDGVDVDVHVYRSMIGSLMYLTASRPDIIEGTNGNAWDQCRSRQLWQNSTYCGRKLLTAAHCCGQEVDITQKGRKTSLNDKNEAWNGKDCTKIRQSPKMPRVHSAFLTDTPMEINMLVEKKYPLKKEILEKMINLKLQAKEESTMAFKLIKFITD
ncbi:putative ribonuclease H-like domain-containing protein [Tanacetum coccineum]